jgi:NAD(P)-dependent dehydrogenase (short-subunit alcohol dehydrogenase family)
VVVNDIDADVVETVVADIVASGGTAVGHVADVSSWDDAAGLIRRCVEEFGALDGLFNNAGIVRLARPDELDEQTLRRVIEVNLLGSAFCGVHAIRVMLRQGHGSFASTDRGFPDDPSRCAGAGRALRSVDLRRRRAGVRGPAQRPSRPAGADRDVGPGAVARALTMTKS